MGDGVTLTFRLVVEVTRTDGKKPGRVAQALAEQLFEFIDDRCKDETFEVRGVDHSLAVLEFSMPPKEKRRG